VTWRAILVSISPYRHFGECDGLCRVTGGVSPVRLELADRRRIRRGAAGAAGRSAAAGAAVPVPGATDQGLTLVHFSARTEPFLTQNIP